MSMEHPFFFEHRIDYVEIYTPMAKALAYWHSQALGFNLVAVADQENSSSYVLRSNKVCLVLTASFPTCNQSAVSNEVTSFIAQNYCSVKRFALHVTSVKEAFENAIANGAILTKFPIIMKDEDGYVEEAAIKLYDHNDITFINREFYKGEFKPGYKARNASGKKKSLLHEIDHIASELRINEIHHWTNYLTKTIVTEHVQSITRSEENKIGQIGY